MYVCIMIVNHELITRLSPCSEGVWRLLLQDIAVNGPATIHMEQFSGQTTIANVYTVDQNSAGWQVVCCGQFAYLELAASIVEFSEWLCAL